MGCDKLKTSTFYDISCDKCGRWASTDWQVGQFYSRQECITWAKNSGWKTVEGHNNCFGCVMSNKITKRLLKIFKEEFFTVQYSVEYNHFYINIDDPTSVNRVESIIVSSLGIRNERNSIDFSICTFSVRSLN